MRKLLPVVLLFFLPSFSKAQTKEVNFVVTPYNYTVQALIYLPANYKTAKSLPVLVFLHGRGEAGDDINEMYVNGPFHFIQTGWKPDFIVVAPQAPSWSLNTMGVDSVFSQIIRDYKGDPNRLYLTGISAGGQSAWNYVSHNDITPSRKISAAILMSAATTPTKTDAYYVAKNKIPILGFGSLSDLWGQQTSLMVDMVNAAAPGTAQFTEYDGGHCCWNQFYDPNYKQNIKGKTMSIYDWMMQYKQGGKIVQSQSPQALPVIFENFSAQQTVDSVVLNWSTASEQNSSYFSIEESDDGADFKEIGKVQTKAAQGNSDTTINYSYNIFNNE